MGVDINLIKNINDFLLKGIKVDFTFLNTVNQKNMKNRLMKRKNLIDMTNLIITSMKKSKRFYKNF